MHRTTFLIPQMDCAAEEQMVRMKLQGDENIKNLSFDLQQRRLVVFHDGLPNNVFEQLSQLNLGAKIEASTPVANAADSQDVTTQRRLLILVLVVNFGCFVLEITTGFISRSMGLVADSLDMLADALVYGLALFAVGGSALRKKNIATTAGYFQLVLAVGGLVEVIRRVIVSDQSPAFSTMIIVSLIALAGNAFCLWLLQKSKSNEPHMRASMIFTSNDVIINVGVIVAGVLVYMTGSNKPDLIIGSIVFLLVSRGAVRILKLGR